MTRTGSGRSLKMTQGDRLIRLGCLITSMRNPFREAVLDVWSNFGRICGFVWVD